MFLENKEVLFTACQVKTFNRYFLLESNDHNSQLHFQNDKN